MDYTGGEDTTSGKISIVVAALVVFFIMLMLRDFLCSKHKQNTFDAGVEKVASTVESRLFSIATKARGM